MHLKRLSSAYFLRSLSRTQSSSYVENLNRHRGNVREVKQTHRNEKTIDWSKNISKDFQDNYVLTSFNLDFMRSVTRECSNFNHELRVLYRLSTPLKAKS